MPRREKKSKPANEKALKHLFNFALLKRMGDSIHEHYASFKRRRFLSLAAKLDELEMKQRIYLIRDELHTLLPEAFPEALKILLKCVRGGNLKDFDLWPITEFIQTFGLGHPSLSLQALFEITELFTAEWAVRPFIQNDSITVMKFLSDCALSKNVHLRRLASEGTRPRLPWGVRLNEFIENPKLTLPILEKLKFDPEIYVRKSIANHLNDIAKDHPNDVIAVLKRWKKEAGSLHQLKMEWTVKRALRTLIKQGHPQALNLIGVSANAKITLVGFKLNQRTFKIGEVLEFQFQLKSQTAHAQKLVIDYIMHFARAHGKSSAKVFKLKSLELSGLGLVLVQKKHRLKEVTTRKHYPGAHALEIQVNGKRLRKIQWNLNQA